VGSKDGLCWSVRDSERLLDTVIQYKPDVVVLAGRWSVYAHGLKDLNSGLPDPKSHFLTTEVDGVATRESSERALRTKIPATIQALRHHGISVVVINSPPQMLFNWSVRRPELNGRALTMLEHREFNTIPDQALQTVNDAIIIDPAEKLCASGTCMTEFNGQRLYADDNHLSDDGALLFEGELTKVLYALWVTSRK
jgi:hypothetical protein